jgi:DNA replication protein DnaC
MRKCYYCEKEYVEYNIVIKPLGINRTVLVPDCECQEIEYKKQKKKEEQERTKQILASKFENSLLTPFFQEKDFCKLDKSEIKDKIIDYVNTFDRYKSTSIMFIGDVGTGKTTLLACACKELVFKGHNCLFIKMSNLLDKFINACSFDNDDSSKKLKSWLLKFDFIVIDDFGREKYTEKRLEIAFDIIDDLLNYKKCIGITANPEMIAKLKRIPDFEAILDRLNEMCGIKHTFTGKSFRRD